MREGSWQLFYPGSRGPELAGAWHIQAQEGGSLRAEASSVSLPLTTGEPGTRWVSREEMSEWRS
jgi:hypothetical protein